MERSSSSSNWKRLLIHWVVARLAIILIGITSSEFFEPTYSSEISAG